MVLKHYEYYVVSCPRNNHCKTALKILWKSEYSGLQFASAAAPVGSAVCFVCSESALCENGAEETIGKSNHIYFYMAALRLD
jgi:hypothetical protein